jgi:hypothetical protein
MPRRGACCRGVIQAPILDKSPGPEYGLILSVSLFELIGDTFRINQAEVT